MNFNEKIRFLIKEVETPFYAYNESTLIKKTTLLKNCFAEDDYELLYAMKANANPQIVKIIISSGMGVDVCSIEEARIALLCGLNSDKIHYNADCLTAKDIDFAVKNHLKIVIESLDALDYVTEHYRDLCISLRINSEIGAGHSEKVITNGSLSKFGIPFSDLGSAVSRCEKASVKVTGLHSHTGSGEMTVTNYLENARVMMGLSQKFSSLEHINFGGGFGYDYIGHNDYDIDTLHYELNELRKKYLGDKKIKFLLEPGRYVVVDSGILVSQVCSVKKSHSRNYIGLDTGHNHFPRCFVYNAWHDMINLSNSQEETEIYDIVGYLCQSGDVFARDRALQKTKPGDFIGIKDVGAYGFSMSSNFNSRVRPAEYLLKKDGSVKLIRRAEEFSDIISTCIMD